DPTLILGTATATGGGTNAGSHAIGVEGLYSSQQGYDINYVDGSLTITPATLTLNAVTDHKTYDGTTDSSVSPTVTGLMNGDSLSGLSQSFDSKNVLGTDGSTLNVNEGYALDDGNDGNNYLVVLNTAT